jgi:hypothetical protein
VLADHSLQIPDHRARQLAEWFVRLDGEIDLVRGQQGIAGRVGHARIDLRDDKSATGPRRVYRRREDVYLHPERDDSMPGWRHVQQDHIRHRVLPEQGRDETQPARVVSERRPATHPGTDERRLENHTLPIRHAVGGIEHEEAVAGQGLIGGVEQNPRDRVVAARDDPRLVDAQ